MIRRCAAQYLYMPGYGYFKRYVVVIENGYALLSFPLQGEEENVEWYPDGVIALFPDGEHSELIPYLYAPFDFNEMKSVFGTLRRQLL